MRRRLRVVVAASLLLGACTGTDFGGTTSSSQSAVTNPTPSSTLPPVVQCPGSGEFEEGGGIVDVDGEDSDASQLGRISWETSDQCETFLFVFETPEGAPATAVPDIRIDHLESFQVIRISLGIAGAVLTDQLVETALVDRLYVVRSLEGGIFVDLHLNAPAAARASVSSSPVTLAVDLRPGFVEFAGTSAIGAETVVVSPPSGVAVEAASQITGYSRTADSNVIVIATQEDVVVFQSADTTSAGDAETWGEFRTDLTLPPGDTSIFVGEQSQEDGSFDGVTLDLMVN
jgi:hypothetical protein